MAAGDRRCHQNGEGGEDALLISLYFLPSGGSEVGMAAGYCRRHLDGEGGEDAFLISLNFLRQVALRWAWQLGIAAVTKTEKVARMHF